MKKVTTYFLLLTKLSLAVLFLYNIGLFSANLKPNSPPPPPLKEDGGRADIQYLNEKIKNAETLGKNYLAKDYFSDLTDIRLKEKQNDFDRCAILAITNTVNQLHNVFNQNLNNAFREKGRDRYYEMLDNLEKERDKHEFAIDPEKAKRRLETEAKMAEPGYWKGVWMKFFNWFLIFYLKNMPLAFILLLIWWYKEKKTLMIKNPISLLLCLILYPVIIIRVWKRQLNYETKVLAMRIEFKRRQADIFSVISQNEISDLKRFVDNNLKISDYRKYLDNRGLVRRHALTPLLIAVSVVTIVYESGGENISQYEKSADVCCFQTNAPPGDNSLIQIDTDDTSGNTIAATFDLIFFIKPLLSKEIIYPFDEQEKRPGFLKNPDPIPLCG